MKFFSSKAGPVPRRVKGRKSETLCERWLDNEDSLEVNLCWPRADLKARICGAFDRKSGYRCSVSQKRRLLREEKELERSGMDRRIRR